MTERTKFGSKEWFDAGARRLLKALFGGSPVEPVGPEYPNCRVCHRPLKNPKYRQIGIGPICLRKNPQFLQQIDYIDNKEQ